jgi:hypothetical protein
MVLMEEVGKQRFPGPAAEQEPLLLDRLVHLWVQATSGVVKYGFAIEYRDLEPPRTGTFDGLRLILDPDVDFEMQCFVLVHLFGHCVQWVSPAFEARARAVQQTTDRGRFIEVAHEYELEASRLGLQLLHERGVTGMDQWLSDFVESDWRYLRTYYETGRTPPWPDCVVRGCSVLTPLAIPEFTPHPVEVRYAF